MGNRNSHFSNEQIDLLRTCTYFTLPQILKIFKKFQSLAPDIVPSNMTTEGATEVTIPKEVLIEGIPE